MGFLQFMSTNRIMSRDRVNHVWVLFVMILFGVLVDARFVVEKSSITVLSPINLRSKHDSAIGNFGIPDYGGTMIGAVVYPIKSTNGCDPNIPFKANPSRPTILLLDRGECYFALKVWNAQQARVAAVLVADNLDEPLITMDSPEESADSAAYIERIKIPSALIDRSFGDSLKKAFLKGEDVLIKLDWTESVPHPDERVEYELWTNSNDECGIRCNEQMNFVRNFKGHAQLLEKGGYTQFTPHYITWYCPEAFILSKQCKSQCINHGRYCAPDPEQNFAEGYEGKDVVFENLRQLCVHRVANETNRSWVWWDFVTDFHIRCSMKQKRYSKECAEDVLKSLDLPVEKIKKCMGDPEADVENPVLKTEQALQVGRGSRGDVTILPTLVINNVQYRGKLERTSVLKAICAGFKETTDPLVCLSGDLETNECLDRNGGCWIDTKYNITACKDTFRGRVCKCPLVNGVQYHGDGYASCEAIGPARCTMNNGGCWSETRNGQTFSACSVLSHYPLIWPSLQFLATICFYIFPYDFAFIHLILLYLTLFFDVLYEKESELTGCRCPFGFYGDGRLCADVDECKKGLFCQCDGCTCKNKWGGYDCKCKGDLLYIQEQDTCIGRNLSKFGWFLTFLVLAGVIGTGLAGYIFYKYRLRSYMDSEIMAIMSQYMPLDTQQQSEVEPLRSSPSV